MNYKKILTSSLIPLIPYIFEDCIFVFPMNASMNYFYWCVVVVVVLILVSYSQRQMPFHPPDKVDYSNPSLIHCVIQNTGLDNPDENEMGF